MEGLVEAPVESAVDLAAFCSSNCRSSSIVTSSRRLCAKSFFRSLVTAPLLLLVIKGIGESGSQFSNKIVKSLHYGLHYAIGSDRSSPRVVESHLCLILPKDWSEDTIALATGSSEGSAERNSDAWVLQTFAAVEKRVQKEGLWTGVTLFDSHVGQIGLFVIC